jgi:hypothetical protein
MGCGNERDTDGAGRAIARLRRPPPLPVPLTTPPARNPKPPPSPHTNLLQGFFFCKGDREGFALAPRSCTHPAESCCATMEAILTVKMYVVRVG